MKRARVPGTPRRPVFAFGSVSEVARSFGVTDELLEGAAVATVAALRSGDPMPIMERLDHPGVVFRGRQLPVDAVSVEVPEWLQDVDDDIEATVVRLAASGRAGVPVLGLGDTIEEAERFLLDALERDHVLWGAKGHG